MNALVKRPPIFRSLIAGCVLSLLALSPVARSQSGNDDRRDASPAQGSWIRVEESPSNFWIAWDARDIDVVGPFSVWLIGKSWKSVHFDGSIWSDQHTNKANSSQIDMISDRDGWIIGKDHISHFDGTSWREVASPYHGTGVHLTHINMVSTTDGWIIGLRNGPNGAESFLMRYNGSSWQPVAVPTTYYLESIDMVSATDGWIGRANRSFLHFDGMTWQVVEGPTSIVPESGIYGISMVSSNLGWALTSHGNILKYSNGSWQLESHPKTWGAMLDIDMLSAEEGWVVGSDLMHYRRGVWTIENEGIKGMGCISGESLLDTVRVVSATEVWGTGGCGRLARYREPSRLGLAHRAFLPASAR